MHAIVNIKNRKNKYNATDAIDISTGQHTQNQDTFITPTSFNKASKIVKNRLRPNASKKEYLL